jgi:pseudouridine kinase
MAQAEPYVCVIGAASVDLAGRSTGMLRAQESNPGRLHVSWGGVGRNIAENLARLKVPVHLLTVLGDDAYGQQLARHARATGMHLHAHIIKDGTTPSYLSISDRQGEMALAIAAMGLLEQLTVDLLRAHQDLIRNADCCVIDTNLPPDLIGFLLQQFPATFFCADLVSSAKADKIRPWLGRFDLIKPNRAEAGHLSGIRIAGTAGLQDCASYFLAQGVGQVFISLGREGLFFADVDTRGSVRVKQDVETLSTTGAGDAMMAALLYSRLQRLSLQESAYHGVAASLIALRHLDAVNPQMCPAELHALKEKIQYD